MDVVEGRQPDAARRGFQLGGDGGLAGLNIDFDVELFERNLMTVNPTATVIYASAKTGEGLDEWLAWLAADSAVAAD